MNLFFAIHLDVYERVGFKVGMTSHSIELYILILVLLTLTFNKGTGVQKIANKYAAIISQSFNHFG